MIYCLNLQSIHDISMAEVIEEDGVGNNLSGREEMDSGNGSGSDKSDKQSKKRIEKGPKATRVPYNHKLQETLTANKRQVGRIFARCPDGTFKSHTKKNATLKELFAKQL